MLLQFVKDLLFGNATFQTKYNDNVLIFQLINQMRNILDAKNTILNGGVLSKFEVIINDLDLIVKYINRGNKYYLNESNSENASEIEFQSEIVKTFFYNFSQSCRGNLKNGCFSNNYMKQKKILSSISDRQTLKLILDDNNTSDDFLTFQSPEYWGEIAKQTIRKKRPFQLLAVKTPVSTFRDIFFLFDIYCQTKGRIVDPFSLKLVPQHTYVDPVYYKSVDSLILYLQNHKNNVFAKTILALINQIISCILNADDSKLPKNILQDETQIIKFLKNIENLNHRIPKVCDSLIPLKLIDVFHRILAMLKLDYMWEIFHLTSFEKNDDFLRILFLRNLELQRENNLLLMVLNQKK